MKMMPIKGQSKQRCCLEDSNNFTSWFCLSCNMWFCMERKVTDSNKGQIPLLRHWIYNKTKHERKQWIFQKSCYHKKHEQAWKRFINNNDNNVVSDDEDEDEE